MTRLTKEIVKGTFIGIGLLAFILLVGSMGALETDSIGTGQAVRQFVICMAVCVVSYIGYRAADTYDITVQDCLIKDLKGRSAIIEDGEVVRFKKERRQNE